MEDMAVELPEYKGEMGIDIGDSNLPTREEYESVIEKLYKSFYDEDIERVRRDAENLALDMAQKQVFELEDEIRRQAESELLKKIQAKRMRISENGVMKNTGNAIRRVSDMTKEERALVAKRAAKGEIINLK